MSSRAQLYKIRRLVKREGKESYEYMLTFRGPVERYDMASWTSEPIDGLAFDHMSEARRICERLKVLNTDSEVIYHSVVPA